MKNRDREELNRKKKYVLFSFAADYFKILCTHLVNFDITFPFDSMSFREFSVLSFDGKMKICISDVFF